MFSSLSSEYEKNLTIGKLFLQIDESKFSRAIVSILCSHYTYVFRARGV